MSTIIGNYSSVVHFGDNPCFSRVIYFSYIIYFQVKEIYNFTQDDLTTEDVLLLDCHEEIYVWIGCHANVKSKQQALMFGLVNYLLSISKNS